MDLFSLGLAALFAAGVFIVVFGIDRTVNSHQSITEARLDRYALRSSTAREERGAQGKRLMGGMNKGLARFGSTAGTAVELARADLKLTPAEYILINLATTIIGYLLGLVIFRGNPIVALVGGVVGFYLPRAYVKREQANRLTKFNNQLGDAIVLLANSLRSGYSLLQAMDTASKEMPAPISTEFARVTREIGLGLGLDEALSNLLRRIPSEDLDLMITAINVQHEVGGNLAEILDTIAFTIRERVRIIGEVRVITSQQRLSGNVLTVMPIVLGFVMYAINPSYVSGLWGQLCGWIMLVVGGIAIIAGYFAIRAIATIEV